VAASASVGARELKRQSAWLFTYVDSDPSLDLHGFDVSCVSTRALSGMWDHERSPNEGGGLGCSVILG